MIATREEILDHVQQQRREQNASLLRIYDYYRIILGVSLLVFFIREIGERLLGSLDPQAYVGLVTIYIVANVVVAAISLTLPLGRIRHQAAAFGVVTADILVLTALMHFSGGVTSGIGALIIISVAAGSILVTGRVATVLAAIATIAVLYEEFYLSLIPAAPSPDFFQAGLLGALYFGTSLFIQNLSRRLERSEVLSLQRATEVAALERLNRTIVQRMRTGVVVFEPNGGIRLINEAGRALLRVRPEELGHAQLPGALLQTFEQWRRNRHHRPEPFRPAPGAPEVRVSFLELSADARAEIIVFVEDDTELQRQAQQLKLAALGRLSASIAHEIRNPLGAISHAAQLLDESEHLDTADRRLIDMIKNHSRRMNGVIENVLELSRRRMPQPEALVLGPWLRDFAERFAEGRARATEIEVAVEPDTLAVEFDPRQLEQALVNLVGNGLRYSEKQTGRPWIGLRAGMDPDTRRPYLDVLDAGPGIDEAQQEHLFEPFYTTEESGTGLGLYLCREICAANQAQLVYRRRSEGGSCFRMDLPETRTRGGSPLLAPQGESSAQP